MFDGETRIDLSTLSSNCSTVGIDNGKSARVSSSGTTACAIDGLDNTCIHILRLQFGNEERESSFDPSASLGEMREEEQRKKQEEEEQRKKQEEEELEEQRKKLPKFAFGSTTTTSFSFIQLPTTGNINNGFSFGNSSTSVTASTQNNGNNFFRAEQRSSNVINSLPSSTNVPPSNTFQHRNLSVLRVQAAVHDYLINTLEEQITNAFITKHPELPDQVSTLRDTSEEMLNEELMALTYDVVNK